jgi:hypothetical protein
MEVLLSKIHYNLDDSGLAFQDFLSPVVLFLWFRVTPLQVQWR